jgi:inositol phosphorylceramide synthase catalytic subunit
VKARVFTSPDRQPRQHAPRSGQQTLTLIGGRLWPADLGSRCAVVAVGVYLVIAHFTFGNQVGQFVLVALLIAGCVWSPGSRRFASSMFPFALMGMVYDCLRLLRPAVSSLPIRVVGPYLIERALFGLGASQTTLNELFARYHWPAVDLACGFAYLIYIYIVFGVALAFGLAGRRYDRLLSRYGWTFFFVNLAAFATYCLCPTAPPWYVATHGLGPADVNALPSPAALVRFDAAVGVPYFAEFYRRSSDVFGAVPSLHCAYPMVVFLYARELGRRWLTLLLFAFYLLVVFSAVYLQHHYFLDTVLGTLYAVAGYGIERARGTSAASGGAGLGPQEARPAVAAHPPPFAATVP